MIYPTFYAPPTVELLQWLARGSLKKNFLKAVRLWVHLQLLYGESDSRLRMVHPFTYADWRDTFFTDSHPRGESIPPLHDGDCPCGRSAAWWLFDEVRGCSEWEWRESLAQTACIPDNLEELLESRLFGLTRRSLAADLTTLAELGCLKKGHRSQYEKVQNWPRGMIACSPAFTPSERAITYNFLQPDLAAIADNLSQELGGYPRFFLQVEYVVPKTTLDAIDDLQEELKQLWQQHPIPPVLLTYNSAKLERMVECAVYPVCIYYVQRAVYLVGFGRNPPGEVNWYNYRCDRIDNLEPLLWNDPRIPQQLILDYQNQTLPTPDYIQDQMSQGWGFDFYQPKLLMLLRFDPRHHRRYIEDTERHETFEFVSYKQAEQLIKQEASPEEGQELLNILNQRSETDAYYQAFYREGDPNVLMRLNAWRPYVEVFLPWKLKERMARDVGREWGFYGG
ncbi:TIGR03985 family CRISPR-associated protein [Laspinema olomoucense]|uniref:TIGR03985 family CRISPR-associated protein n=1 Tax=Laspinema olomoucense TaxID=3231600 RepID=UPI0021BA7489|nr:TIGR03985 family CRISPR-associated protein [Laspinema sp. D3c]MCT7993369.1 TIGR03985 family CRISPR-associated protein [Laspinema sp. D3c]